MAKHKYIENPEIMWELFIAYKAKVKSNPITVKDWVGGAGKQVMREKERPLTMEGLELYAFEMDVIGGLGDYFSNKENRYEEYAAICSRIRQAIREDQITGGMAGIYNPSITQRLNGLVERVQEDGSKELTIKVKYERKNQSEAAD